VARDLDQTCDRSGQTPAAALFVPLRRSVDLTRGPLSALPTSRAGHMLRHSLSLQMACSEAVRHSREERSVPVARGSVFLRAVGQGVSARGEIAPRAGRGLACAKNWGDPNQSEQC